MNNNENSITYMDAIAKKVKDISQNHRFFKDCGSYSATEQNNGTCERVVCESLMAMFHLENWQKNSKKLGAFLNQSATDDEFQTLSQELDRLEAVVGDKYPSIYTSKDSFLFFALFHRFTLVCDDDSKFADFLSVFQEELHCKVVESYGMSFDDANANRATKDKSVIIKKLDILEALMIDFLHIEKVDKTEMSQEQFITECTGLSLSDVKKDTEFYNQVLDDLEDTCIKDGSKLLNSDNRLSMLALVAYSYKSDVDLEEWLTDYASRNIEYYRDPKKNYLHMIQDLEEYNNKRITRNLNRRIDG